MLKDIETDTTPSLRTPAQRKPADGAASCTALSTCALSRATLETERLILRRPVMADARAIAAIANDRRIAENTACVPFPYRLRDAEEFLIGIAEGRFGSVFAITRETRLLGIISILRKGIHGEIGYWLGAAFWRQGVATEAVGALVDQAFSATPFEEIRAGVRVTNEASRRVLEKCGFRWTGVALHRFPTLGSSVPVDRMVLTREGWAAQTGSRP